MGSVRSSLLESLKPLIPILLPALERHGRLDLSSELRDKLLMVSAATMDRLLSEVRTVARGGQRRRAGMSSAVRRSVPVRTFGDWNDPLPGYVEVDFVAHSGTSSSGSFVQTMVLTDIATGWTECVAVRTRESGLVIAALRQACSLFPFPLLGVDFDNDSAFMNELVVCWCRAQGLEVPGVSAASVLERLKSAHPSRFTKKSLRTVQMAVKAWRIETAGQILLDGDWMKRAPLSSPAAAGEDNGPLSSQTFGNIPG
ncbi:transposase (plasmid) [Sinorhizobium americanum CCGM7]|uniref:integrase catalytic domain-containing protein n=1 Tax=Sinorhizobium americanum TaxID=194963 RepID=UPI0004D85987|nr:transposase family protein [Sinorhizobium americanum]APG86941.1 transposase [Sinorhizobium americanum CCGM7]